MIYQFIVNKIPAKTSNAIDYNVPKHAGIKVNGCKQRRVNRQVITEIGKQTIPHIKLSLGKLEKEKGGGKIKLPQKNSILNITSGKCGQIACQELKYTIKY